MKKVLMLPFLAMVALVSQAWGQEHCKEGGQFLYCQWSSGCFSVNNKYDPNIGKECSTLISNCVAQGSLFSYSTDSPDGLNAGNSYGEGVNCKSIGLTWTGKGKNPDGGASLGWCDWGDCVFDPADDYSCLEGGCFEIESETQLSDCQAYKTVLTSKSQCPKSSLPKADGGTGGGTPVIKLIPASQALLVAPYGRSLHISSARDAMVSLYDMSGARVYSGRVRAGNSVFSLEKVAVGSYYAVVQSGSDAKKVPVILK